MGTIVAEANLSDAKIKGANFTATNSYYSDGSGLSIAQLYSTGSYKGHDLSGVGFQYNKGLPGVDLSGQNLSGAGFRYADLTGADFSNSILVGANFYGANLTGADFSNADLRGSQGIYLSSNAILNNVISSYGEVSSLILEAGQTFTIADFHGISTANIKPVRILVQGQMALDGGALRLILDANHWDSPIMFASGIPVSLAGVLDLELAPGLDPLSQIGRTVDLFDWTGVEPTGAFSIGGPYVWDTSDLYKTGEVTLVAVPEPSSLALSLTLFILCWLQTRVGRYLSPRAGQLLSGSARTADAQFLGPRLAFRAPVLGTTHRVRRGTDSILR